jgi:hypothetical protein
MDETNRRRSPRRNENATILVSLAPDDSWGNQDNSDLIPVKMGNQSQEGIYIEIDQALEPGSNVSVKMVSPEGKGDHPENAYFKRDGQVVWCRKFHGRTPRFGVGIKILRTVVQADVLTSRFRRPAGGKSG